MIGNENKNSAITTIGLSAGSLADVGNRRAHVETLLLCLRPRQPDARHRRIGVNDAGDGAVVGHPLPTEEVLHDHPCLIVCGMCVSAGLDLTLSATHYMFEEGRGDIVVNGDEIDFFNGDSCGLQLPQGVGRYRWKLSGTTLTFTGITVDPCGRVNRLDGATYMKG